MKKSSHLMIGRLLCRRLNEQYGIYLNMEGFLLGCILPDLCFSFLLKPHILPKYRRFVLEKIEGLLACDKQTSVFIGRSFSVDLGVICHFYADFLCYPHSGSFKGELIEHVRYESELNEVMERMNLSDTCVDEKFSVPGEITAIMVFDRFMELHGDHSVMEPSYINDISHSIRACMEMLVLLTSAVTAPEPDIVEMPYPA